MTIEEFKSLNMGKGYRMKDLSGVCAGKAFVPPDDDVLGLTKTPEASKTYNGMSIADVQTLQKFKYSDDLHRPDLIKEVYTRANRLQDFGKTVGAKEFIKSYVNIKK